MRSILFGALLGSLGVVGCGGDDTTPAADGGIAVGDGGRDMGARRDMAVTPPAYEFAIDDTAFDTGAAYRAANDAAGLASLRAQCDCFFFQLDFADADSCFAELSADTNTLPPAIETCIDNAFTAADATVKAFQSCRARLADQIDSCLGAPDMCVDVETAVATCFSGDDPEAPTTFDDATLACQEESGVTQEPFTAYNDATAACLIGTGADTCGTGSASSTVGPAVFTGTTLGAGDHRTPTAEACGTTYEFGASPDKTFTWTAPSAGTFKFDTLGTEFDTVLYAVAGCAEDAAFLGCNDDGGEEVGPSELTLTLTSGQTIYLAIDGYAAGNGDFGDFVINITQVGASAADAGVDATVEADAGVDAAVEADAAEPDAS